jgi:hypothetical protein
MDLEKEFISTRARMWLDVVDKDEKKWDIIHRSADGVEGTFVTFLDMSTVTLEEIQSTFQKIEGVTAVNLIYEDEGKWFAEVGVSGKTLDEIKQIRCTVEAHGA